jgi:transposase
MVRGQRGFLVRPVPKPERREGGFRRFLGVRALWTSRAVRELVERRFGKRLGLSTVRLYLRRWGMTPQKPLVRAKERSPAAIAAWLARDYPASPGGPRPCAG